MDPLLMKQSLIEFCQSIQIDCVGIAPATPYLDFAKIWRAQIEKGNVTGFEEKDFNKRVYPHLTLPSAASVVVCLFPYYTGKIDSATLSNYSFGRDYHIIVKQKLELIAKFLDASIDDFEYKAFSDTGPFSDRYLAHKAGLGFYGINNLLINDKYGSYFFIGYILNNYPFEPDNPLEKTCFRCMNCVRQCPAKCIKGDFTIDVKKCSSYITQKKTALSEEEVKTLKKGKLIWGCDVCQEVCPHNRRAQKTVIDEFKEILSTQLDMDELKNISNKEFMRRYRDRAFSWRGKKVLERNYEIIYGDKPIQPTNEKMDENDTNHKEF